MFLILALHIVFSKGCVFQQGVTTLGGTNHRESERMGLPLLATHVHLTPEGSLVASETPLEKTLLGASLLHLQTSSPQRVELFTDHMYNTNFASQVLLRVAQPAAIDAIIHKSFGIRSLIPGTSAEAPKQQNICIASTSPQVLRTMEGIHPEAITILEPSEEQSDAMQLCQTASTQHFNGFTVPYDKVDEALVQCAQKNQLLIGATNVDTAYDIHQLIYKTGVDFILTDHPALYKRASIKEYPEQGRTHLAFIGT